MSQVRIPSSEEPLNKKIKTCENQKGGNEISEGGGQRYPEHGREPHNSSDEDSEHADASPGVDSISFINCPSSPINILGLKSGQSYFSSCRATRSGIHLSDSLASGTYGHLSSKDTTVSTFVALHEDANSGFRPYMEDRTATCLVDGMCYVAVYDGHGGCDASSYLQQHLVTAIQRKLQPGQDVQQALRAAFLETNDAFRGTGSIQGSTATAVILNGSRLFCANVGDSPAFLIRRNGSVLNLIQEHKIDGDEYHRVVAACAPVIQNPVGLTYMGTQDGTRWLNMSRAFGDFVYPAILCEPFVSTADISDAKYLVVGSDGLTERLPIVEVAKCVRTWSHEGLTPQDISRKLVETAKASGSTDNISVAIVDLSQYRFQMRRQRRRAASGSGVIYKESDATVTATATATGDLSVPRLEGFAPPFAAGDSARTLQETVDTKAALHADNNPPPPGSPQSPTAPIRVGFVKPDQDNDSQTGLWGPSGNASGVVEGAQRPEARREEQVKTDAIPGELLEIVLCPTPKDSVAVAALPHPDQLPASSHFSVHPGPVSAELGFRLPGGEPKEAAVSMVQVERENASEDDPEANLNLSSAPVGGSLESSVSTSTTVPSGSVDPGSAQNPFGNQVCNGGCVGSDDADNDTTATPLAAPPASVEDREPRAAVL